MHEEDTTPQSGFAALQLAPAVLSAIERIGYEQPTPIQAEAIPHLLVLCLDLLEVFKQVFDLSQLIGMRCC